MRVQGLGGPLGTRDQGLGPWAVRAFFDTHTRTSLARSAAIQVQGLGCSPESFTFKGEAVNSASTLTLARGRQGCTRLCSSQVVAPTSQQPHNQIEPNKIKPIKRHTEFGFGQGVTWVVERCNRWKEPKGSRTQSLLSSWSLQLEHPQAPHQQKVQRLYQ